MDTRLSFLSGKMKPRSIVLILRGLFGNSSILSNIFAFLSQKFELSSIRDGSTLVVGSLHLKLVHSLAGIGNHDLITTVIAVVRHAVSLLFRLIQILFRRMEHPRIALPQYPFLCADCHFLFSLKHQILPISRTKKTQPLPRAETAL